MKGSEHFCSLAYVPFWLGLREYHLCISPLLIALYLILHHNYSKASTDLSPDRTACKMACKMNAVCMACKTNTVDEICTL